MSIVFFCFRHCAKSVFVRRQLAAELMCANGQAGLGHDWVFRTRCEEGETDVERSTVGAVLGASRQPGDNGCEQAAACWREVVSRVSARSVWRFAESCRRLAARRQRFFALLSSSEQCLFFWGKGSIWWTQLTVGTEGRPVSFFQRRASGEEVHVAQH